MSTNVEYMYTEELMAERVGPQQRNPPWTYKTEDGQGGDSIGGIGQNLDEDDLYTCALGIIFEASTTNKGVLI
jgi:hypothetical protein